MSLTHLKLPSSAYFTSYELSLAEKKKNQVMLCALERIKIWYDSSEQQLTIS